jgi:hypothetical protein
MKGGWSIRDAMIIIGDSVEQFLGISEQYIYHHLDLLQWIHHRPAEFSHDSIPACFSSRAFVEAHDVKASIQFRTCVGFQLPHIGPKDAPDR